MQAKKFAAKVILYLLVTWGASHIFDTLHFQGNIQVKKSFFTTNKMGEFEVKINVRDNSTT